MKETKQALADLQSAINNVLKDENVYPPEQAVRCTDQKSQEIISFFGIEDPVKVGSSELTEALRVGFVENFRHFGVKIPEHFYKFERTAMGLELESGSGQISWKISSHVTSYHIEEAH